MCNMLKRHEQDARASRGLQLSVKILLIFMKLANVLLIIISLISVIIFLKIGIKNTGNWRFYSSLFGMIGMTSLCIISLILKRKNN